MSYSFDPFGLVVILTSVYNSIFVGHATAEDMVHHFNTGVSNSGLSIKDMVQISIDVPSVN